MMRFECVCGSKVGMRVSGSFWRDVEAEKQVEAWRAQHAACPALYAPRNAAEGSPERAESAVQASEAPEGQSGGPSALRATEPNDAAWDGVE